jgi:hypothetical protein
MSHALQPTETEIAAPGEGTEAPRRPPEVIGFSVRGLLELAPGAVLETSCHQSMDIPLRVNGLLMAWTEFEVVGERLAARITDMA